MPWHGSSYEIINPIEASMYSNLRMLEYTRWYMTPGRCPLSIFCSREPPPRRERVVPGLMPLWGDEWKICWANQPCFYQHSIGLSIRSICTSCFFAMTNVIQVCSDFIEPVYLSKILVRMNSRSTTSQRAVRVLHSALISDKVFSNPVFKKSCHPQTCQLSFTIFTTQK